MDALIEWVNDLSLYYELPKWLVVLGPIAMFLSFVFLIVLIFKILEPKHRLYKEDIFYDVIWRWRWRGDQIIDLWCYCPTCKAMLYVDDENSKATSKLGEKITFFVCHDCGESEKGRIRGGGRKYSLQVIKREIVNKIRSKSYDIYKKPFDRS